METAGIEGIGSIVILKFCAVPVHPFRVGVATKFPVCDVEPVLVPVNADISPEPDVPKPIVLLELVQFTVVAAGVGLKLIAVVFAPAQTV